MGQFDEGQVALELSDGRTWLILYATHIGDEEYAVLSPETSTEFKYVRAVKKSGRQQVEVVEDERIIAQIQAGFLLQQNGGSRLKALGQVLRNRFGRK